VPDGLLPGEIGKPLPTFGYRDPSISDSREAAVDRQHHPIHVARIV